MNVIDVQDLSFSYGSNLLFSNVSFRVEEGDYVALTGTNGAGKSTLLKLLLGELPLQKGIVTVLGTPVENVKEWQKIGYVPQKNVLAGGSFPATVQEIVQANLYSQIGLLGFPKKNHKQKVQKALAMVGMEKYADRLIGTLSGGQQQRVMIARALVNDPVLLLLDEPTTGIDPVATEELYSLLKDFNENLSMTVMMVTHDIRRAVDFASRTFCLEDGSLIELAREQIMKELFHKHTHPEQAKTD